MEASFSSLCKVEFNTVEIEGVKYSLTFQINSIVDENAECREFVISGEPESESAQRFGIHLNANDLVAQMRSGDRAPDTFFTHDYLELANPFVLRELEQAAALSPYFREEFATELLIVAFLGFVMMEMARFAGDRVSYEWIAFYAFTALMHEFPFPKTFWVPWDDSIYE